MSLEIWQDIPAVPREELRPIMSTLTDHKLTEKVMSDIGLELDSWGSPFAETRELKDGRFVVARSIEPSAIDSRIETPASEVIDPRWFHMAEYILLLYPQRTATCYGGSRKAFSLQAFSE